jgi:hypothetical protein
MEQIAAHTLVSPTSPFAKYGYQIFRGDEEKLLLVKTKFRDYLYSKLKENGVECCEDFCLENYHEVFKDNPIAHHEFIGRIKRTIPGDVINPSEPMILLILEVASKTFGKRAKIYNDKIEFRVVRPGFDDNNKLHRDHWFPYFYPLINIYLPLSSSYCDSAMKVVPGSHTWSDEDVVPEFAYEGGKSVNASGIAFSVPGILKSSKEIHPHRPDILPGDFMLFSPLSIHGGGDNSSSGTRFSFEIRIELAG